MPTNVPGHEIVGRVGSVGPQATRFKPGDAVARHCLDGAAPETRPAIPSP